MEERTARTRLFVVTSMFSRLAEKISSTQRDRSDLIRGMTYTINENCENIYLRHIDSVCEEH